MNPDPESPNKISSNPYGQNIQPNPIFHPSQPNINSQIPPPPNQQELRSYPNQSSPRHQPYPFHQPNPYQPHPYLPPNQGNILEISPVKVIVFLVLFILGIILTITNKDDCLKKYGSEKECQGNTVAIILFPVSGGVYILMNVILLLMDRSDLPCHQIFLFSVPSNQNCCMDFWLGVLFGILVVIINAIAIFIFIYFLFKFKCFDGDRQIQQSNINAPASSRNLAQRY